MTLRDLQALTASFASANGIADEHIEASLVNDGLGEIAAEIVDDSKSSKYAKRQSFSDVLAGIIEVANPSYEGRWTTPAMVEEVSRLEGEIRASSGVSTISLSGVLSNIANKSLLSGYESQAPVLRKLAKESVQDNMKEQSMYRTELSGDLMPEVGASGEIKHGGMVESSYSNRPVMHAKMLGISEEMLLNDDLGSLVQAGQLLGAECAKRIELELAKELMDALADQGAGKFFDPASNYLSGAGSALSIDALGDADAALADMLDSNGDPIDMRPSYLLVTGGNRTLGRQLMNSVEIREAGAANGVSNPFNGYADLISSNWLKSSRMDNPAVDANWFLVSVSKMHAPLLLNFVKSDVPRVQSFDSDPNMLGSQIRCSIGFGVSLFESKSIIACAGA